MRVHFLVKEEENPYLLKPRVIYTLILCCKKQAFPLCKDIVKKIASYLPWNFAAFQNRFKLLSFCSDYKEINLGWHDRISQYVRHICPTCFLPMMRIGENCGITTDQNDSNVECFLKEYNQGKILLDKDSEEKMNALQKRLLLFPYSIRRE